MKWYVSNEGGEPIGPLSTELIERGVTTGRVPLTSVVCREGGAEWIPLSSIAEFAAAARSVDAHQGKPLGAASVKHTRPSMVLWLGGGFLLLVAAVPVIAWGWSTIRRQNRDDDTSNLLRSVGTGTVADNSPVASPATATSFPRLSISCPPTTWPALRDTKPASWQRQQCGSLSVSYKLFPASGARLHDSLTVLQHYPRGNRRAAAVFKSAVEAFGPELGRPTRSVGGCRLTDGTKASLLAVGGTTLVAKAEVALREQGGYRAAIFEVDGYRITAALHDADATRPDTAIIGWTDGDAAAANEYAEVPWDGRNLCE